MLAESWRRPLSDEKTVESLRTFCVFCGQWISTIGPGCKQHHRLMHQPEWQHATAAADRINSLGLDLRSRVHTAKSRSKTLAGTLKVVSQFSKPPWLAVSCKPRLSWNLLKMTDTEMTEETRATLAQTEIDLVFGQPKNKPEKEQDQSWAEQAKDWKEDGLDSDRPSKWGKKDGGKGAWRPWNSGSGSNPKRQWEPSSKNQENRASLDPQVQAFLTTVTRAVLRHEADLTLLRADTSYVLFIDISEHSCLQRVKDAANHWQELFTAGTVSMALKTALLGGIVKDLKEKLKEVQVSEELLRKCHEAGWVTEGRQALDPAWVYHAWDPQAKKQIVAPQFPRSNCELLKDLDLLLKYVAVEGVVHRFKCTKTLSDQLTGEVVPFMITISLRSPAAHEAHQILGRLSGNACCKLLGMRLKPERGNRSQMSKAIEQAYMNLDFCEWKPRWNQSSGSA